MQSLKTRICAFLTAILFASTVHGQAIEITGVITDADTGEGIPGATIIIKDTSDGTISDYDGNYILSVTDPNSIVEISFIGYQKQNVSLDGRTNVDIVMYVDNNQLDEVVVVGYGVQKKKVVTGAIASISNEEINSTPTLRVEQALQGRTPGVQVSLQSGQPGDEPAVRIRGIGTTGNARPLFIVDGLAVSGIDYLNPGDIETIDVLKDAASAAIYGARAANGVILITTKTGANNKMNVGYDMYYGTQNVANTLEMLNAEQYKMMMNEGARNAGLSEPFDLLEISTHDTDWQEELFEKNAPMQNHQVSITGGSEKSSYSSSFSFFSQEGIIGGSKSQFDRITGRLNSTHKVNKFLTFGNNLGYTHLVKRGVGANQSFNGAYSSALNLDPLTPLYETDEDVLAQYPYSFEPVVQDTAGNVYGISENVGAEIVNPLALLETDTDETRKDQLVGNIFAELEMIKDLKFKSTMGVDMAYLLDDGYKPLFFLNGAQLNDNKTSVNKRIQRFFTWQWENTLIYSKSFGAHNVSGLAGITASEYNYEDLSGFNAGVPTNDPDNVYLNLATDTVWTANGGAVHSALYSLFGRVNYDFNDKYSVTAIIRRDGSSKFGANRRFGIFPSIGFAWVASDEAFLREFDPISYLKFRASWGINGNQEIGDYQFLSTINQGRGYDLGNGTATGSSPLFLENADIRWEESEQYNFGIDFGWFENKLQGNLDIYQKTTNGLLEKIAIPGHVGNDGPVANVGSVENKGIELALNWRTSGNNVKYFFGINGAYNKNTMIEIGNAEKVIPGAGWAIAGAVTRTEEGLPISYFWGYETAGLFQNENEVFQHFNQEGELLQPNAVPGDVRFVDVNGDGVINDDDRTNLGNPTPSITYGANFSAEYKGFDFSMFVQGVAGNQVFNGTQRQDLRFTNRTTAILDRWTGEGTSDSTPRYTWSDTNNNYRVSDLYIEDASYIRIKNIQIGYNLPSKLLKKFTAESWRFYISVENIATFTKYTGVDPEIGAVTSFNNGTFSAFDMGIDRGVYPFSRTMRFGTSILF